MLKLLVQIAKGHAFHYHDRPDRVFVKEDDNHSVNPAGTVVRTHPHVLVVERKAKPNGGTRSLGTEDPRR